MKVEEALLTLQDCLCSEISKADEEERAQAVCICTVVAGDGAPLDYCGPGDCGSGGCGIGWVRLVGLGGVQGGGESMTRGGCAVALMATVEIGIARCSLTALEDGGDLPDAEAHLAEFLAMTEDLAILRSTVQCCAKGMRITIGEYTPFGPEGGCIGGAMLVQIEVD